MEDLKQKLYQDIEKISKTLKESPELSASKESDR